jgi:hypothetical protein
MKDLAPRALGPGRKPRTEPLKSPAKSPAQVPTASRPCNPLLRATPAAAALALTLTPLRAAVQVQEQADGWWLENDALEVRVTPPTGVVMVKDKSGGHA